MTARKMWGAISPGADHSHYLARGPLKVTSVFQPILRAQGGLLQTEIQRAHVRVAEDGAFLNTADFMASMASEERVAFERCLLSMHLANASRRIDSQMMLMMSVRDLCLQDEQEPEDLAFELRGEVRGLGLRPSQIIIDIPALPYLLGPRTSRLSTALKDWGFHIASGPYAIEEGEHERLSSLSPDFVILSPTILNASLTSSVGITLIRSLVSQFRAEGIEPIFAGLEEAWQLDLCLEVAEPLLSGYTLGRPLELPLLPPVKMAASSEPVRIGLRRTGAGPSSTASFGRRGKLA